MDVLHLKINDEAELVQLREEDAEVVFALIEKNRSFIGKWLPWVEKTQTVNDERAFLKSVNDGNRRNGEMVFGIFLNKSLVGVIGINQINKEANYAEFGYWLDENATGKGSMTNAVYRLMQHCFEDLGINRVGIYASEENAKSRAVIERAGCSFEGILKEYVRVNGEYHNAAMYGMLSKDFKKQKK